MTLTFLLQCLLGMVVIAAWIVAGYCAFNRDTERRKAQREAELAAFRDAGKDKFNPSHYDFHV